MKLVLNIFLSVLLAYIVKQIYKLYSWYNNGKSKGYTWALNLDYVRAKTGENLTRYLFYLVVVFILFIINNN